MAEATAEEETASGILAEALTESSTDGLRSALYLIREEIDRSTPQGMFAYVLVTRTLVQHGLNRANADSVAGDDYRRVLLPALYNLSADTWIGWGDANEHAATYQHFGLEAAELNVTLRNRLGLDARRRGMAYWMQGAHQLAAGDVSGARDSFATCLELAESSADERGVLMSTGWLHVAAILAGTDESAELDAVAQMLADTDEDGAFFAGQFDAALVRLAPVFAAD